jgi:hypothetical protein
VTSAIRDVTDKPVTHVLYSHHHGDHIGATSQFPGEAIRIAQAETCTLLEEFDAPARKPEPCARKQLHPLSEAKGSHARGCHLPRLGTLCQYRHGEAHPGVPHHDPALAFGFDHLITGHLTRLGTRQDVLAQREYMQDIQAAAQHALEITEVKRDLASRTVGRENLCVFFKTMYDAAAAEAAQPVVKSGPAGSAASKHSPPTAPSSCTKVSGSTTTPSRTWCCRRPLGSPGPVLATGTHG